MRTCLLLLIVLGEPFVKHSRGGCRRGNLQQARIGGALVHAPL